MPFAGFYGFPSSRWPSCVFLGFLGLLAVLHGVLDSNVKLCAFCCQWTRQGGDWQTKWSVPWFNCDESLTLRGLNSNPGRFRFVFILSLFRLENHVCLSHGVIFLARSGGDILYGALAIGVVPGCNSILNSMALSGGIPGNSSRKTSKNSQTTWISSSLLSTTWCKEALMRAITGRCRVTLPCMSEYRWTNLAATSKTT
jgi:hypothetical protein